jgi:hypothetical protein
MEPRRPLNPFMIVGERDRAGAGVTSLHRGHRWAVKGVRACGDLRGVHAPHGAGGRHLVPTSARSAASARFWFSLVSVSKSVDKECDG